MDQSAPIQLTAQLYRIISNADGGGRLIFDFGHDSMEAIQELFRMHGSGEVNFALAIVPYLEPFHESFGD